MLTSGSRRLERADKLTRRLADTHKRRVVYLYTAVHDDGEAVLFSVGGGFFVDHAGLHPQYPCAGGHGVFGHRHDLPATPEHVDYVHRRGDILDRLVRLFAKYRTMEIRVDGEDLEPEALQCARDRVAGAVRPVRKSDDSHGARALQKISYLAKVRVCVHVALFVGDLGTRCYTISTPIGARAYSLPLASTITSASLPPMTPSSACQSPLSTEYACAPACLVGSWLERCNLGRTPRGAHVGSERSSASFSVRPPGLRSWWKASVIAGMPRALAVRETSATVQTCSSFSSAR